MPTALERAFWNGAGQPQDLYQIHPGYYGYSLTASDSGQKHKNSGKRGENATDLSPVSHVGLQNLSTASEHGLVFSCELVQTPCVSFSAIWPCHHSTVINKWTQAELPACLLDGQG